MSTDSNQTELAAMLASLPPSRTIQLIRWRPLSPVDPELFALFKSECSTARIAIEETHKRLELKPSWKTICKEAASADDAFSEMQDARERYALFLFDPTWLPGWRTPAEALVRLALEANRQAELCAELGDVDGAIALFMEGQAYMLELEAGAQDIRLGQAKMRRISTEEARATRLESERQRQVALFRDSLTSLAEQGQFRKRQSGADVVLALQHYWQDNEAVLGFDPYEIHAHLARLFKALPEVAEEFSALAGITGSLTDKKTAI